MEKTLGTYVRIFMSLLSGASLPPEIAAEGSWAQMYYQQVAVLSDTLKGMQESFQPVWELAKVRSSVPAYMLITYKEFDACQE